MTLIIKFFIGCPFTSELRMHLHESDPWKQLSIAPMEERLLVETRFQQKDYLGHFFEEPELPIPVLKEKERHLKKILLEFCPDFNVDRLSFCVFPQLFVI